MATNERRTLPAAAALVTGTPVHVVTLDGPDMAGHWGWRCTAGGCPAEETGHEPEDVEAAAEQHGAPAADSPRPTVAEFYATRDRVDPAVVDRVAGFLIGSGQYGSDAYDVALDTLAALAMALHRQGETPPWLES